MEVQQSLTQLENGGMVKGKSLAIVATRSLWLLSAVPTLREQLPSVDFYSLILKVLEWHNWWERGLACDGCVVVKILCGLLLNDRGWRDLLSSVAGCPLLKYNMTAIKGREYIQSLIWKLTLVYGRLYGKNTNFPFFLILCTSGNWGLKSYLSMWALFWGKTFLKVPHSYEKLKSQS